MFAVLFRKVPINKKSKKLNEYNFVDNIVPTERFTNALILRKNFVKDELMHVDSDHMDLCTD